MNLKEQDINELIDKNFMFLTMLGYVTSIIFDMEKIIEGNNMCMPEKLIDQIDWFKTAIENIVYKNIPAPKMP